MLDSDAPLSDLIPLVKQWLEEGYKETKAAATKSEFYTWTEHYDNWICIVRPLIRLLSDSDKYNSMVFFRFVEIQKTLMWIYTCVLFGAYHSAIRELRYVLESMMQAYYLDREHTSADMGCKLEIIKEIDRERFSALVDRIEMSQKQRIKVLYSELSKYVHSTYNELRPTIEEGKVQSRVTFGFESDMFKKCVELTNQVMDVVYCITLQRFPQTIMKIESRELTLESFRNHGCTMTLDSVRNQGAELAESSDRVSTLKSDF